MVNKTSVVHDDSGTQDVATEFKAPDFMEDDINLWFAILERKFEQLAITSQKQRYDLTINALPTTALKKVRDIIMDPPSGEYDQLRARLVQEFEISVGAKFLQLLTGCELGNKKPSALLHEMRQLAEGHISDKVLIAIFLGRLPIEVQVILAGCTDLKPEQTAMVADRIMEYRHQPCCNCVNSPLDLSVSNKKLEQLEEKMAKMLEQFNKFEQMIFRIKENSEQSLDSINSRVSSPTKKLCQSSTPVQQDSSITICFYHKKYGMEARKCHRPCSFGWTPNVSHVKYE